MHAEGLAGEGGAADGTGRLRVVWARTVASRQAFVGRRWALVLGRSPSPRSSAAPEEFRGLSD